MRPISSWTAVENVSAKKFPSGNRMLDASARSGLCWSVGCLLLPPLLVEVPLGRGNFSIWFCIVRPSAKPTTKREGKYRNGGEERREKGQELRRWNERKKRPTLTGCGMGRTAKIASGIHATIIDGIFYSQRFFDPCTRFDVSFPTSTFVSMAKALSASRLLSWTENHVWRQGTLFA